MKMVIGMNENENENSKVVAGEGKSMSEPHYWLPHLVKKSVPRPLGPSSLAISTSNKLL